MRLVEGGIRIGPVLVQVQTGGDVDVVEEDRWLSLSSPAMVEIVLDTNPLRTHTDAFEAEPSALGDVVLGMPWKAVVIDVDADVPCLASSVELVATACAALAVARGMRTLRLPLLGSARGKLDPLESARAIARGLERATTATTALTVVIVVDDGSPGASNQVVSAAQVREAVERRSP